MTSEQFTRMIQETTDEYKRQVLALAVLRQAVYNPVSIETNMLACQALAVLECTLGITMETLETVQKSLFLGN